MFPAFPNQMKFYTNSSPYAVPSQPPFKDMSPRPTRQTSFNLSPTRSSTSSINKPPLFSARSNSSSFSSTSSTSTSTSASSSSDPTTKSLSTSIKSIFRRPSPEERAVRKAEKERQRRVEKAERQAYQRAQDMEATAMYMAWSM